MDVKKGEKRIELRANGEGLRCQGKRLRCMQWAPNRQPCQALKKSTLVRSELGLAAKLRQDPNGTCLNVFLFLFCLGKSLSEKEVHFCVPKVLRANND